MNLSENNLNSSISVTSSMERESNESTASSSSSSFTSPIMVGVSDDTYCHLSSPLNILDSHFLPVIISPTRFIPTRKIGAGTFATVYEALDSVTGSFIAMKKVYTGAFQLKGTSHLKTSLEREISLLTKLRDHKHVVKIYGYGVDEHFCYIYMELIAGTSLFSLIKNIGPLEESMIRRIIGHILNGLVHLHSIGIIHRDIKTRNILLSIDGTAKLVDFGGSCQTEKQDWRTMSANYSYTPLFVAPEVLKNKYNAKADIWALGCVFVEMASGLEPWTEKRFENAYQCLQTIAETNEIPKIPTTLSANGMDFALKCLDRNPITRPSATDLLSHPFLANQ